MQHIVNRNLLTFLSAYGRLDTDAGYAANGFSLRRLAGIPCSGRVTAAGVTDMNTCTALILLPVIRVPLTRGQFALVNECDARLVLPYKWQARLHHTKKCFYAYRCVGKRKHLINVSMARAIFGESAGVVDHKNGITLDNRRSNLRSATHSQNAGNRRSGIGKSKYKGVHWKMGRGKKNWLARIGDNGNRISLGSFYTEEEAARAYNRAAIKKWGEFAYLNIIDNQPRPAW
jgi:hypothetical protein